MKPTLAEAALGLALIVGVVFSAALGSQSCGKGKVQQAEATANVAHGAADAHRATAQQSDAKVAGLEAEVAHQKAALAGLLGEREALRRNLAAQVPTLPSNPDPAVPVPGPPSAPDVRDALIAKDAEVIAEQARVIESQGVQLDQIATSRDQWKLASEERAREAAGLRIALDAQKSVANSGKWVGRIQGVAIGIGAGFVAGRLR